jgi:hypothetical protein
MPEVAMLLYDGNATRLHSLPWTTSSNRERRTRNIEESLPAVANVLNLQRGTDRLWRAATEQTRQVGAWERAGITLYAPEIDSFRFHALETSLPVRRLQRDAEIPRTGSVIGWVYDHHTTHVYTCTPGVPASTDLSERRVLCVGRL